MHYWLLGLDTEKKDQAITQIQSKTFKSEEEKRFDCETIHGHKMAADEFKQALMTLPAVATKRLVIIRQINKLTAQNQKILLEFLEQDSSTMLVLDGDDMEETSAFGKKIKPFTKIMNCGVQKKGNVFDVTNAIGYGRIADALKQLHVLIGEGNHPLQLMGGLTWFWGKQKQKLSKEKFKKGLLEIQEADINIKRSRLRPEFALEKLIVQLALLLKT